ncbi:MAG: hypothetical protein RL642_297 [Bacteroidota bacterium]|jgi:hypothetical protein
MIEDRCRKLSKGYHKKDDLYEAYLIKKYPMWQNAKALITDIAYHSHVEAVPIAEYRRFVFFIEYYFYVKGTVKNLEFFERYSHAILRKTTKSMSMWRKVLRWPNR